MESTAANSPEDDDHDVFWLVSADQFARRGIICDRAGDKALATIDGGSDIAAQTKLGTRPPDLAKRQKMLAELRARLTSAAAGAKARTMLKKPQAFLMGVGDVLIWNCTSAPRSLPPRCWHRERP
jgi:hypothetical protein